MVGRVTPNSAAICATVYLRLPLSPVSAYIARAGTTWRGPSSASARRCARGPGPRPVPRPFFPRAGHTRTPRSPQHGEEHPSRRGRGVHPLIEHDEIDAPLPKQRGQLDQIRQRPSQPGGGG